jgi:hypothetical protein
LPGDVLIARTDWKQAKLGGGFVQYRAGLLTYFHVAAGRGDPAVMWVLAGRSSDSRGGVTFD